MPVSSQGTNQLSSDKSGIEGQDSARIDLLVDESVTALCISLRSGGERYVALGGPAIGNKLAAPQIPGPTHSCRRAAISACGVPSPGLGRFNSSDATHDAHCLLFTESPDWNTSRKCCQELLPRRSLEQYKSGAHVLFQKMIPDTPTVT